MATLILSTVGTVVGGPVGSAIGAMIGQQIDQNILFKPKDREGPRLEDLSVQLSQYGRQVPRIYGRMRSAGTVIWATDLQESSERQGGGKGQPGTKIYTYSVSFAVALSSRPVKSIGRIWAEGNLLRGVAGDFKTETDFRFYSGYGDQHADPLIAAAQGIAETPAHRGLAYVVFEDMDLTEYGNRIPSLTLEVIADDGQVTLHDIAADHIDLSAQSHLPQVFDGFASSGSTVRAVVNAIGEAVPLSCSIAGDGLDLRQIMDAAENAEDTLQITAPAIAASNNEGESIGHGPQMSRSPERLLPARLGLRYYDPQRDYQAGLRHARHADAQPRVDGRTDEVDLPAVISAGAAQKVVDSLHGHMRTGQYGLNIGLSHIDEKIVPGVLVRIEGQQGIWRVRRWQWREEGVILNLVKQENVFASSGQDTQPGQIVVPPDFIPDASILRILNLPAFTDTAIGPRNIFAAVSGQTEAWRGAHIYRAASSGDLDETGLFARAPATIGMTSNILGNASPLLCDEHNYLDIVLQHDGMLLKNASAAQLAQGANLASVGEEVLQFARAENIAPRTFRLSRLWRGRGGTEYAVGTHIDSEDFVLIDESLIRVDPASSSFAVANTASYAALGPGDDVPVIAGGPDTIRSLEPFAPVHLQASWLGPDTLTVSWVRRSRLGYSWRDYVDVPLGEESECYIAQLTGDDGTVRGVLETGVTSIVIDASVIASARADGVTELEISIIQKGQYAASRPAKICVPLL